MLSDINTIVLDKRIQNMIRPYAEECMGYHNVSILTKCGQWLEDYHVANTHTLYLHEGDEFTLDDIDCVTVKEPREN